MARTSRKQKYEKTIEPVKNSAMKIALYVRLSNADNGGKSKDSIYNQLELLLNFAKQLKDVECIETYIDNGQTGTDFARLEWERMMEDIKRNKINCIIVKDLSRFARNYLEAGDYLEKIFPFLGVRFLAINDYFDSAGEIFPKKEPLTELKNLANDFYSKDISQKTMSAFRIKKEQGQFIGNKAPYGYLLKDNHFVIDEAAAVVVRRIFSMKIQGISSYQIANQLNQEKILSPSRYAGEHGMKKYKNSNLILWQQEAVNRILYNRVYIGDLVQGKYNCSIYSKEKQGKREEHLWEIRKDTHPAIVDRELFFKVQEIKEKNRKIWKDRQGQAGYKNILEGILVCGICHHGLRRRKERKNGKIRYYYYCGFSYAHSQAKCNSASIVDHKIFDIVFRQIKLQIDFAVEMENLIEQIKKLDNDSMDDRKEKKELEQTRRELDRYRYLKMSIYRDMKQGILTREEFFIERKKYEKKISELEIKWDKKEKEANEWRKEFLNFKDAKMLTRDMAVELVEKVEVYQEKRIHIRFRFRDEYSYFIS